MFDAITKQAVTRRDEQPRPSTTRSATPIRRSRPRLPGRVSTLPACSGVSCRAHRSAGTREVGRVPPPFADRESRSSGAGRAGILALVATLATPRGETSKRASSAPTVSASQPADIGAGAEAAGLRAARSKRDVSRRRVGRGQAGSSPSAAALHHLDAAAGGRAASSASRQRTPCGSPNGSTRASISAARLRVSLPTCGPTACRWPKSDHRHPPVDRRRLRRSVCCPRRRRRYQTKAKNAQEVHEAYRRPTCRAPRKINGASGTQPGEPLRTGLAAHRRQPDGIRRARANHRREIACQGRTRGCLESGAGTVLKSVSTAS